MCHKIGWPPHIGQISLDVLLLWLSWVRFAVIVEESPEIIGDVALIFNTIHGL